MIFRARFTRAFRAVLCAVLVIGLALAIHAEIATPNIEPATRWGWMAPTILVEIVLLGGLIRLWVVRLVVKDSGVTVHNFRGNIRLRRREIKSVERSSYFVGFGVAFQLKTGDKLGLDGLIWATPRNADRAVAEITQALGLTSALDVNGKVLDGRVGQ